MSAAKLGPSQYTSVCFNGCISGLCHLHSQNEATESVRFNGILPTSDVYSPVECFHVGRNKDCTDLSRLLECDDTHRLKYQGLSSLAHFWFVWHVHLSVSGGKKSHQTSTMLHDFVVLNNEGITSVLFSSSCSFFSNVFKHLLMMGFLHNSQEEEKQSSWNLFSEAVLFFFSFVAKADMNVLDAIQRQIIFLQQRFLFFCLQVLHVNLYVLYVCREADFSSDW